MKRTILVLSVLLTLAGTAPASAAFLGANPRLGESLLNTGIEQVSGDVSREGLPGSGGAWLRGASEFFVAPANPRTITPYRDPLRPGYNNGATHIDHAQARALGGSNAPSNLRPLAAETNLRKGGFEGQLKAYEQYLIRNGMSPKDARSVIQAEIDALRVSPPPRPMDPRVLDQLPANPLDQGYPH